MGIMNLTQHKSTPEQRAAGVFDLEEDVHAEVRELLTFDALPTREEIEDRAADIALIAAHFSAPEDRANDNYELPAGDSGGFALQAMIGGAPFLMAALEAALLDQGIRPVYAFSRRESAEETQPDGTVRKTAVFRHAGFVETR